MIYIGLFLFLALIMVFLTNKKQSLIIVLFLFLFFLSFSFPSGGDWIGYFNNYDCLINTNCVSDFTVFEVGYETLVKIFGNFGFQSIIAVIALINTILIGRFATLFDRPSLIVVFFMCVFLWSLYVEAIRQALALSIILLGLVSLYNNKIKKYIMLTIFASFFHITALICLLFILPYLSKRLSIWVGFSFILLSLVFILMPIQFLEFLIKFIPSESMIGLKINFYLFSDAYSPKVSVGMGTVLDFLLIIIVFLSFSRVRKYKLYNNYRFHNVVFIGVTLYFSFAVFIGKMMPVLTRIGWYGFPFIVIVLYINIGKSVFYNKVFLTGKIDVTKYLIFIYFSLQILRPLTYEYNYYGIVNQQTIFQKFNHLDDLSLRVEAREKCSELNRIGYGYLCNN